MREVGARRVELEIEYHYIWKSGAWIGIVVGSGVANFWIEKLWVGVGIAVQEKVGLERVIYSSDSVALSTGSWRE